MVTDPHNMLNQVRSLALEDYLYTHQVKLLFSRLPFYLYLTVPFSLIFAYSTWDKQTTLVITWLICISLTSLTQFILGAKFTKQNDKIIKNKKWERMFLISNSFTAALWGLTVYWIGPDITFAEFMLQVLILACITGCSLALFSARAIVYITFLLVFTTPYLIQFYRTENTQYYAINLILISYVVIMIFTSLHTNKNIRNTLTANYTHNPLINALLALQKYDHSIFAHYYDKEIKKHRKISGIGKASEASQITADAFAALSNEIEKHHELEQELLKSRAYLESILTSASDVILTCNKNGIIQTVNNAIERDFGYKTDELIGKSINLLLDTETAKVHDQLMGKYFTSGRTMINRMLEINCRRKDGSIFPIEIRVSHLNINDQIIFISILRDISERKESENKLRETFKELQQAKQALQESNLHLIHSNNALIELSQHDALTGLYNRRYLEKTLAQEWLRHRRAQTELSIILLDIDYFKRYNDHYGHIKGDECLVKIAQLIQKSVSRPADFVARYGGEEFIVVLPTTAVDGAYNIATKICSAVYDLNIEHTGSDKYQRVSISAGVAGGIPNHDNSYSGLIELADQSLYLAKQKGRNRVIKSENDNTESASN